MKKLVALCLYLSFCLIAQNRLDAQQNNNYLYTVGNQPFGTQIPIENGFINVNNGDIHIEIPLAQNAQRGSLPLNERLVYDSRIWKIIGSGGYSWSPTNVPNSMGGWTLQSGQTVGSLTQNLGTVSTISCGPPPNNPTYTETQSTYAWTDPSGTVHPFTGIWTAINSSNDMVCGSSMGSSTQIIGFALDASGYTILLSGNPNSSPTSMTVYDRSGNEVYPLLKDPNGNFFGSDSNGNLTDTLGRTPVLKTTSGSQIFYDVLTFNGARSRYTVNTETISYHTSFGQSAVGEVQGSFTAIQSIQLPDGSSYSFSYDSGTASGNYGELTGVTLPTGGTISYGYTNFLDSFQNQNRWVHTRIKDGGTTTFAAKTISNCSGSSGCQEQVTVNSPALSNSPNGNDTVYTFTLDKGSYYNASSWNTGIDVWQGLSTGGGSKLTSQATSYTYAVGSYQFNSSISEAFETPQTITTTTTLPDVGLTSKTLTTLDSLGVNPLSVQAWDYYSGSAPTTPTRTTTYTYGSTINYAGFLTQATVKDGAGNQLSSTSYGYDGNGNKTSETAWVNTANPSLSTTMAYDTLGVLQSVTTPAGKTTYGHDSNDFCTTSISRPTTNSVQHISSATCDASTGLLTSQTDENSKTTKYSSYDALNRLLQVNYPDGGLATFSYPSSTESIESHALTSSVSSKTTTTFDSYGRKSHVTVADPEGDDTVDYAYDTSGRLHSQSNPHRASAATTDGATTFSYDALGRPLVQTQPDASTKTWTYLGNTVTAKDEIGNQWKQTSDGLGRLTQVLEPSKTSQSPTVETDYAYNVFTTTVTQRGVSGELSRTRTFVTDSLGRPITTTTPEAGTICYGTVSGSTCTSSYDANGNLTSKTDARGQLISTNYDALNRPTREWSADGTVDNRYYWDVSNNIYNVSNACTNGIGRPCNIDHISKAGDFFNYDAMGRVTSTLYATFATAYANGYSAVYDYAGNIRSLTYPDGRVVTQGWDTVGHQTSSIYASYNGIPGYQTPYLASATYFPSGSPQTISFANGETETWSANPRLQPTEIVVKANATGFSRTVEDKRFCYGPSTSQCGTLGKGINSGNILGISDALKPAANQTFTYDNLNRLSTFGTSDGSASQSYVYDSFGNMNQSSPGTSQSNLSFAANNRIYDTGFSYDAAGNLVQANLGTAPYQQLAYDALSRLLNVNNGAATYTYDGQGNRARKDVGSNWTEYVYFNGQPMAEHHSDGTWSDYIYANGQRIARADSWDNYIHIHGTMAGTGNYAAWNLPLSGYVVKNGDTLSWRQLQGGGARGGIGIVFSDGTLTTFSTSDTSGYVTNDDTRSGNWYPRTFNLSSFASKTITQLWIVADSNTPAGTWDILFGDIDIVEGDATVLSLYSGQTSIGLSYFGTSGATNTSAVIGQINTVTSPNWAPGDTYFYHGDQLGSSRLISSGEGWPSVAETYYPFGLEEAANADPNHYKYTGLEQDAESSLDHATFRQYAHLQGRWLSPDPYDGSYDPSNPQSFNRYAYALNNPLSFTDPSGRQCQTTQSVTVYGDGSQGNYASSALSCGFWDAIAAGFEDLGHDIASLFGFGGSSFKGVVGSPRPGAEDVAIDNPYGRGVFGPQSLGTWTAANTSVKYAAAGTTLLYGGAALGPGAISGTLQYGAQAIGAYQATALGTTGIVLGAYGENPNYVEEAAARGMNAFNIPSPIYSVLNATGNGWTANEAFLKAGIASGQAFYLSSAPYTTGGFGYLNEILYLSGSGITPVPLP